MALAGAFLDEVRARTVLSALIGRSIKLTKAGREFKACCPFHGEKTPSFTVNDDKGFAHCFGCGWHGDAFRWLADHDGTPFIEAVRELAQAAGMDMPAPGPEAAARAARIETVREALDAAQAIYARQIEQAGAVMEYLAGRGIGPAEVAAFGIGFARGQDGSLRGSGIGQAMGREAGLLVPRTDDPAALREQFWDRITVPIHDHKGRLVGFGGRVWPGRGSQEPKFVNSPEGPLFDKGRTLFNLHRASESLRALRRGDPANGRPAGFMPGVAGTEGGLIIVEGYFDVVALARAGIAAAVAPLGTALTLAQLERAWRVHHRPVLLFDGDRAGRAAAVRACRTALPAIGPGRELAVALLPEGKDPDDLVQELGPEAAGRAIGQLAFEAAGMDRFLFDCEVENAAPSRTPEQTAAIWMGLRELALTIGDEEVRAQYLGQWRARFERECSAVPQVAAHQALTALSPADPDPETGKPVAYAFPEREDDSAKKLIALVRALVKKRAERRAIGEEIRDLMAMARLIGFTGPAITAVVRDIESDLAHGSAVRESFEMDLVLYRRTLGVKGPLDEAMLPTASEARVRLPSAQAKRRSTMHALIDARAVEV